ncbi:2-aminoethylphosphonate--pyruvate transaminase [Sulfurospirillum barnesii]|uniref:2-aminoethylphosphonate--pyruvate transaminase n=1 Tax=Sulfurospirillum barnesii (strain ATCC 700032 / DSM 10660 / SES-3) TaxID=760154 RepID=I3XZ83_SULBS|nr:2-aminoethylphosphonate--pyruvate transaminase [Sulfurospirillum barnesii]AFL69257.1 2-aminoethylphosphonate--pyruvate transaminase [Sulfurospirillum barnesii SES-3]
MPRRFCTSFTSEMIPENPYLLLTPGPLSTTKGVRASMLQDWCTWDHEYNQIVQEIRSELVTLASKTNQYTSVLMQGSGTFSMEAALGTMMPRDESLLLVLSNGAYGERMVRIAEYMGIDVIKQTELEMQTFCLEDLEQILQVNPAIRAVSVAHCETTTGILNPIEAIGRIVKQYNKLFIVDAMSSFGGIPIDMDALEIDVLISSANKCIQGVPGFGFIIFKKELIKQCQGNARSLSLDAYDQWEVMEKNEGKWRFTSPTHVVRAFGEALYELQLEGGIAMRHARYVENQQCLVKGMEALGFTCVVKQSLQSPIITSFYSPLSNAYDFQTFYDRLKESGFVIYPGKVSCIDSFRIGTIGDVYPKDITNLLEAIKEAMFW